MKSGMIDAEQEKRLSMNIEYLKYFAELAKLQHYGKAAKALNISQPGLSHAIKTLEDEYGVPLFQKEGRNVSLSRYGKELMQDVEEILDAYLRMEERAAGLRTEEKTVRIGTVYPLAAGTIPHMLREFGATFPFIIYNRLTPEIEEGLLDGKYDIGFCSKFDDEPLIEFIPVAKQDLVVIVPPEHPLAEKSEIHLEETLPYKQIIFKKRSGLRQIIDQLFKSIGQYPDVAFEIDEDQVAAGFVANDFGICIAPDIPILHSLDLKILPLVSPSWQRNFYMAMLKDVYHPPVVEAFKKFVIEKTSKEIFYKTN